MTPERNYPENRFTLGKEPIDTYLNMGISLDNVHDFIYIMENSPEDFHPAHWLKPTNKDINRLSARILTNTSIKTVYDADHAEQGITYAYDLIYFITFTAYLADILADDDRKTVIKNLEEIEFLNDTLIENKELHNRLGSILRRLRDAEV